ncbi:MAG TPA: glucosamine-6-phosphate deaminase [Candidatus Acidoferrum sp.]
MNKVIVRVFEDKRSLSTAAADQAANAIHHAILDRGRARIVVATGTSQLDFLDALVAAEKLDWQKVELFHLDEYVGLPITHPASFRKYLLDRLIHKTSMRHYHLLDANAAPHEAALHVGQLLSSAPVDIAFAGIGENAHLAFNDPPADFQTEAPYLIVNLDEACRRQQVGEAWFSDISEVPRQAISMSIRQILKAKEIIAVVPDARKALAVKLCLEGEISPLVPASILRTHPATTLYLDKQSASLLSQSTLAMHAAT